MLPRPKVGETEEDLLKQEEEFLKQSGKEPTQKRNLEGNRDERKSPTVPGIVGEVVERSPGLPCTPDRGNKAAGIGFPALFKIDPELTPDKKGKKSLFALHMEKNKNVSDRKTVELDEGNSSTGETGSSPSTGETGSSPSTVETGSSPSTGETGSSPSTGETGSSPGCSKSEEDTPNASGSTENNALSDDKKSIHKENSYKLAALSESDILRIQKKLRQNMNPKVVSFLKKQAKRRKKAEAKKKSQPEEVEVAGSKSLSQDEKIKEILRNYVGDKWMNMDVLEKEKLEWVGDIPSADALQPDQSYSARFDFNGELQPYRTEIDVTNALYHHGDEPERPGYTIQELYQLSRSAVRQQRILALNALANIIYKSKLGYYDACFDGYLLQKLLEADLFFLLRFSIDEKALIPPAMNCLRRLLYNDSDEYCLDRLLGTTEEDMQPLLYNPIEADDDEEKELTDISIIHSDLIKGVLRTDLLIRINYILNRLPCKRETVTNAILCLISVARHSTESCDQMLHVPNLLRSVYSRMNCDEPIYEAFKFFRVLAGQSRFVAVEIGMRYSLDFSISFLNMESVNGLTKRELYLLKLECIYLWRNLIRCGFMKDDFICWTPCFVRLLRFYVERVDIYAESDFDFELFSALMAMLRFCVCEKLAIDSNYVAMMSVCLEKWMNQLLQSEKFTYSSMKALGSCFAFFINYFEIFGSDKTSLTFIRKLNGLISTLMGSPCFDRMATNLTDYSHLLIATPINRDPINQPSLCSVYENGEDFLRIVNNQSTLPFFAYFTKYLQFSYQVLKQSKNNVELFVNHPAIRKYVTEVIKLEKSLGNWFERYEISLLADVLQLFCIVNDPHGLKLGFRLMPMIRLDERDFFIVLAVLTDRKNWGSNEEFFEHLLEYYSDTLFKAESRSGYAFRYKNDLAGEDWAYKSLTILRGRDAPMKVTKILRYLSLITWREPHLLERIPFAVRYYHLCTVYLTDSNVFNEDIQAEMRCNFRSIVHNREKVDLSRKVNGKTTFYDLYTDLITQYAAVSYSMHIFAEFVLFPLQNRFDVTLRKLVWFEYLHVLRVITVPYPSSRFIDVAEFVEPYETDESLLVAYLNSVSSNVISKQKNPFIYHLAISNINNYMKNASPGSTLYNFLSRRIRFTISERIKRDLTSW